MNIKYRYSQLPECAQLFACLDHIETLSSAQRDLISETMEEVDSKLAASEMSMYLADGTKTRPDETYLQETTGSDRLCA